MSKNMARTVADAMAQELTIPEFKAWRQFAALIDGYSIADELGLKFGDWCNKQKEDWENSKQWDLELLHLRIMLFYAFRSDKWTGYTYTEHNEMADTLLQAIAEALGQSYQSIADSDEA